MVKEGGINYTYRADTGVENLEITDAVGGQTESSGFLFSNSSSIETLQGAAPIDSSIEPGRYLYLVF